MRLLNVKTFEIEEFFDPPKYAILSHTWDSNEPTLQQWQSSSEPQRRAYAKATLSANQATQDNVGYVWIDTLCIDKTSSAELSEAINSMYRWYEGSRVCYAYLSDIVHWHRPSNLADSSLKSSKWFTRGWTLQELLAPKRVVFYSAEWAIIGERDDEEFCLELARITGIQDQYLSDQRSLTPVERRESVHNASVAERLSWVSNRVTTRPEDIAYCLLGILGINMPLLYGEREKAWIRLQKELIAVSDDETIFAWSSCSRLDALMVGNKRLAVQSEEGAPNTRLDHLFRAGWRCPESSSMLSSDPANYHGRDSYHKFSHIDKRPYSMTNAGLRMKLPLLQLGLLESPFFLGALACSTWFGGETCDAVVLVSHSPFQKDGFRGEECSFLNRRIQLDSKCIDFTATTELYIGYSAPISGSLLPSKQYTTELDGKSFCGFWFTFPEGRRATTHRDIYIGPDGHQSSAFHRWGTIGIYGFEVSKHENQMPLGSAFSQRLTIYDMSPKGSRKKTMRWLSLELGITIPNLTDGPTWTIEVSDDDTGRRTRGSMSKKQAGLVELHLKGIIKVVMGTLNTSLGSDRQLRMVYITFD